MTLDMIANGLSGCALVIAVYIGQWEGCMFGLVLWYNEKNQNGLVWCEDQGPLACICQKNTILEDLETLRQGQLIRCKVAKRDGIRTVLIVSEVEKDIPSEVLREILTRKRTNFGKSSLQVVA
ncbi:hypothetical protein SAMN04488030_1080 [Aliiroseovarius halocynthiae]|uniref:Uncharacterized protein n=1 Tax=Aliiroseovarius halocynthiae TaxID=985055 RepID=A0A545SVK7_9RHOB|nr:hypothetical protein [Aliiroseovarius halocynthiae]TQV68997.1 hypothetical protein FIL88_05350 [Aliiroseovarius halocynthiae]SMR71746.1 hypothetical protein SAMN04488030_1080 [Aliiroseovarius halocynthiae]